MKRLLTLCLAAAFMVGAFAGQAMADKIILAVAGAHSGDLASYGLPSVNAAKLVADMFNAKGGVLGKEVVVQAEDEQCKSDLATNVATKLVSDGARIVLGHICSGATKAALPIYLDGKMVVMSPSATNPPLTQSGDYPNFFRTIAPDDAQALLGVQFAVNELGAKKIAILHDKQDYGKGYAEFAKKFVEESGKAQVVLFEGITPGAVDYTAAIQSIRKAKADCVIYGGYHPEASKLVTGMHKKRMKTPFVSDDGVKDDTFIKVARKNAEGVYASSMRDNSANPLYQKAVADHKAKFGSEPGAFFENAYAAAICMLTAVEKAGSTDYNAVMKALRANKFDTPVGKIGFDEKGDAIGVGFSMYQVQNGKYVEVK